MYARLGAIMSLRICTIRRDHALAYLHVEARSFSCVYARLGAITQLRNARLGATMRCQAMRV